ncbi:MAG: DUF3006 domain-containing protein [Bacillota bacterium]
MKGIIDRFEEDFAYIEIHDKTMLPIARGLLPKEAKEGDVLVITIDQKESDKLKKKIEGLMDEVWEDS